MPEIIIPGPVGRIEAMYKHNNEEAAPIALMLHPHPIYGGTMNNKVVYSMYHTFAEAGFNVLRFNFRGVGNSQGEYDKGEGELEDATAALEWLQANNPRARACWVGGFSFGAWIGMQLLMRRPEVTSFVSIAPPANMYDFSFLAPCPTSGLMVHGTNDQVAPLVETQKLVERLHMQKGIHIELDEVNGANHYFQGQIDRLDSSVASYLSQHADYSNLEGDVAPALTILKERPVATIEAPIAKPDTNLEDLDLDSL